MKTEIQTFVIAIGAVEISDEAKKFYNRPNYFRFPDTQTLLIIKISRTAKPFFGVDKLVIDDANQKCDKFYLVLLVSDKAGWIYSKSEVNSNIKNGFWNYREDDRNYKINNSDLDVRNSFSSNKQFLDKLNERGGKGDIDTKQ